MTSFSPSPRDFRQHVIRDETTPKMHKSWSPSLSNVKVRYSQLEFGRPYGDSTSTRSTLSLARNFDMLRYFTIIVRVQNKRTMKVSIRQYPKDAYT
jgi:hypothetical protein